MSELLNPKTMERSKEQKEVAHDYLSNEYFPFTSGNDKVNQSMLPGDVEIFDSSAHSTPAALKITTTSCKDEKTSQQEEENNVSSILRKRIESQLALWKSYEEGVKPSMLYSWQSSSQSNTPGTLPIRCKSESNIRRRPPIRTVIGPPNTFSAEDLIKKSEDLTDIPSDKKICADDDSDKSTASSWDETEGGIKHYDAWQVMKDEYAKDAGFVYNGEMTSDDFSAESATEGFFRILGTSADDTNSHPHVMSPPLMESLLSFVPDQLAEENLWLKFSMVRDGASLETLQELSKYSQNTFLAVETLEGDVFGSFTSTRWSKQSGFYGSGEAFLWKMRSNRLTPCFSLIEQAQLESDIYVYPYSGRNKYVQLCTGRLIAVGGGNLDGSLKSRLNANGLAKVTHDHDFGFGIAINDDLSRGSTSPCGTFLNPSLVGHSSEGQIFKILNLEIWAFTPCATVKEAEIMEIAKAIRAESFHKSGNHMTRHGSTWSKESKRQGISSTIGSRNVSERSSLGMGQIIIPGG